MNRLLTRDPASGEELVVTRMWCPTSGVTIEGEFSLGWLGRLSPEQLDFVGLLLRARNNLQRLATELGVSYNTARSRLDEIVSLVGGVLGADDGGEQAGREQDRAERDERLRALDALAAGELTYEEALNQIRR